MARRTLDYRKMKALEDVRKLEQLTALGDLGRDSLPDPTCDIPGTGPEKMVYNFLKRLVIRFQFQYHEEDLESTGYPEHVYVPDFNLPDYNTRIQVFGQYWHTIPRRALKDIYQIARNLYAGRMLIEHGIPTFPEGGDANGKYIIWWEYEIYFDLDHLFARDLPELFSPDRITGQPEEYILDYETQKRIDKSRRAAMIAARLRPKIHPFERQLRKLRKRTFDISKIYPLARRVQSDLRPRTPKGIYETRGRRKKRY